RQPSPPAVPRTTDPPSGVPSTDPAAGTAADGGTETKATFVDGGHREARHGTAKTRTGRSDPRRGRRSVTGGTERKGASAVTMNHQQCTTPTVPTASPA